MKALSDILPLRHVPAVQILKEKSTAGKILGEVQTAFNGIAGAFA